VTWYIARDGRPVGPYTFEQLRDLAANGQLRPGDLVWQEGAPGWVQAFSVARLFAAPAAPDDDAIVLLPERPDAPAPPAAAPAGAGRGWLDVVLLHLRRAFSWNLRTVPVAASEMARLRGRGVEQPVLQRYLAWRWSVLLVASLPACLMAILSSIDLAKGDYEHFSAFGRFWLTLHFLAPYALPVSILIAACVWSNKGLTRRVVMWGWLVSFLLPLLLLLVPARWLFDFKGLSREERPIAELAVAFVSGLAFFLELCGQLPIFIVSAAQGAQRACVRLKTLLPGSSIPGLFLVLSAPVFPVVMYPVFVFVNQLAGSPLLLFGMAFLMTSPLLYLFSGRLLIRPTFRPEDFLKARRVQLGVAWLFYGGAFLLLIYAFTKEWRLPEGGVWDELWRHLFGPEGAPRKTLLGFREETSFFRPWSWRVFRWLVLEWLGRSLFTTILIADLFIRVDSAVWGHSRDLAAGPFGKDHERQMGDFVDALRTR
jgi:hypothetical protein